LLRRSCFERSSTAQNDVALIVYRRHTRIELTEIYTTHSSASPSGWSPLQRRTVPNAAAPE
jgi:hypothetical protein